MKNMAETLAREHSAGMSPEKLLALARHDTWLKTGPGRNLPPPYPGATTDRIAEELLRYLRSELRILIDSFWKGRTSVELVVQGSRTELAGFFNGDRPGRQAPVGGRYDDAHSRQHVPYV
jgi:hypothetical protein